MPDLNGFSQCYININALFTLILTWKDKQFCSLLRSHLDLKGLMVHQLQQQVVAAVVAMAHEHTVLLLSAVIG